LHKTFTHQFSSWTSKANNLSVENWTEHFRVLNDIADLITPQFSLREIIAAIYENVNLLIDAYQFCVGIYDDKEGMIHYVGIIENGKPLPDFSVNALDEGRLASWCVRHEEDIFMNDFDAEYKRYLSKKPEPLAGSHPKAALYTPLKLNDRLVGFIAVRTIHKNVYHQHHLYLLKTVGNFVVRALELAKKNSIPYVQADGHGKQWRWNGNNEITPSSKKLLSKLTEREKEVLLLLATGLPNKKIAERLFVSPGTIKTHTLNIYEKMEVSNRSSAVVKAIEWRWLN
jgi:DNA-binding CsgD family transcriptional regulator/transcriptional regulator with GAF, ATPase, and Fis domain